MPFAHFASGTAAVTKNGEAACACCQLSVHVSHEALVHNAGYHYAVGGHRSVMCRSVVGFELVRNKHSWRTNLLFMRKDKNWLFISFFL
jgi:hypothetical protein